MAKYAGMGEPRHHRNQLEKEHQGGLHENEFLGANDQCRWCDNAFIDNKPGSYYDKAEQVEDRATSEDIRSFRAVAPRLAAPWEPTWYAKHAKTDENGNVLRSVDARTGTREGR